MQQRLAHQEAAVPERRQRLAVGRAAQAALRDPHALARQARRQPARNGKVGLQRGQVAVVDADQRARTAGDVIQFRSTYAGTGTPTTDLAATIAAFDATP